MTIIVLLPSFYHCKLEGEKPYRFETLNQHQSIGLYLLYIADCKHICDTIKGNESLVENFNFNFLAPLSETFKMLHFDANPITIGYPVTEL